MVLAGILGPRFSMFSVLGKKTRPPKRPATEGRLGRPTEPTQVAMASAPTHCKSGCVRRAPPLRLVGARSMEQHAVVKGGLPGGQLQHLRLVAAGLVRRCAQNPAHPRSIGKTTRRRQCESMRPHFKATTPHMANLRGETRRVWARATSPRTLRQPPPMRGKAWQQEPNTDRADLADTTANKRALRNKKRAMMYPKRAGPSATWALPMPGSPRKRCKRPRPPAGRARCSRRGACQEPPRMQRGRIKDDKGRGGRGGHS